MINSPTIGTMAFLIQSVQAPYEAAVVSPMEATSAWLNDSITMLVLGY